MEWNWIDLVVVIVVGVSIFHGWRMGFVHLAGTLISFLGSLWLAVRLNEPIGLFLNSTFGIPVLWGTVIGYIVIGVGAQFIIAEIANYFVRKIPKTITESKYNEIAGAFVGLLDGLIILAFFLIIFLILPIRGTIQNDIKNSKLGSGVVKLAETYGGTATSELDRVARSAVQFLTVTPGSRDRMNLPVSPKEKDLKVDSGDEETLLELLNTERTTRNIPPVVVDKKLTDVARAHSRDMFLRHYFSHVSPEGDDGAERMKAASIQFSWAGENLAYAGDVTVAHQGLVDSENHRRNMLDPEFKKVGIGIIDAGIFGKMITEDFTN